MKKALDDILQAVLERQSRTCVEGNLDGIATDCPPTNVGREPFSGPVSAQFIHAPVYRNQFLPPLMSMNFVPAKLDDDKDL